MYSILFGAIVLGFVHALIPNHWLPLVAVGRTEKWSQSQVMLLASITASAHVLGTVVLGTVLGIIGTNLAHTYEDYMHDIAPVLLIVFGLIYCAVARPHVHQSMRETEGQFKRSKTRWIWMFVLVMFLSPCLEVQSLFLAIGAFGIHAILLLGLVYALISIICIMAMVYLTFNGLNMIKSTFVERHEKRITGLVLIVVGIVAFFIH